MKDWANFFNGLSLLNNDKGAASNLSLVIQVVTAGGRIHAFWNGLWTNGLANDNLVLMHRSKEMLISKLLRADRNIILAFVFGSEAKGMARGESDIDIAVLMNHVPPPERRLAMRSKITTKLGELLGREVDLVLINTAGNLLKYQIARNGRLLFERDKGAGKRFRLNAIKEYFDYLPTFNFHYQRLRGNNYGRRHAG